MNPDHDPAVTGNDFDLGKLLEKETTSLDPVVQRGVKINSTGGRVVVDPVDLVDAMRAGHIYVSDAKTGLTYDYQKSSGIYKFIHDQFLYQRAAKILGDYARESHVREGVFLLKMSCTLPDNRSMNDVPDIIPVKNGAYNYKTGLLEPHNPKNLFTSCLQADYDPECEHPVLDRYRKTSIVDRVRDQIVQEYLGLCFTTLVMNKALILLGPMANGKSTLINAVANVVGPDNFSAIPIHLLEDNFARFGVLNKRVNMSSEVSSQPIDTAHFKACLSGDSITGSQKFKDPITFKPFAKWIVACNVLPRSLDNSPAFFSRLLVVRFPRVFGDNDPDRDPFLLEKLKGEASGIFMWGLKGLQRLLKNGKFTSSEESIDLIGEYKIANSSVASFVQERCALSEDVEVVSAVLFDSYKEYCKADLYKPFSKIPFFRELRSYLPALTQTRLRIDGRRTYVTQGITLRDEDD